MMKQLQLFLILFFSLGLVQAQDFDKAWYTDLSVDSFFNTEAAMQVIDVEKPNYALLNAAVFFAANEARAKKKLPLLVYNESLEKAAVFHSEEMRAKRFFSHVNKTDKDNRNPEQRIANQGGDFKGTGENILEMPPYKTGANGEYEVKRNDDGTYAFIQANGKPLKVLTYGDFGKSAVKLWMKSPEHKANILSKQFAYMGCGTSVEEDPFKFKSLPMVLVTQNFGAGE